MSQPTDSPAPAPEVETDAAKNIQVTQASCWILLCYLGEQGVTIRSVLVPKSQSSQLLCEVEEWFEMGAQPTLLDEKQAKGQTNLELVWVIRGQPFTDDDKEERLTALRLFALDVMRPDIEERRGGKPHNPFEKSR